MRQRWAEKVGPRSWTRRDSNWQCGLRLGADLSAENSAILQGFSCVLTVKYSGIQSAEQRRAREVTSSADKGDVSRSSRGRHVYIVATAVGRRPEAVAVAERTKSPGEGMG